MDTAAVAAAAATRIAVTASQDWLFNHTKSMGCNSSRQKSFPHAVTH
jgi:hypothetical protein